MRKLVSINPVQATNLLYQPQFGGETNSQSGSRYEEWFLRVGSEDERPNTIAPSQPIEPNQQNTKNILASRVYYERARRKSSRLRQI